MDADDIEEAVEDFVDEANIGDSKLESWIVKKGVKVFIDKLTDKKKAADNSHQEERRVLAYAKDQRDQAIFEMRKQKETLAIQKLQTEIAALKAAPTLPAINTSIAAPSVIVGELPSGATCPSLECADNPDAFKDFLQYVCENPTSIVILGSKGYGKSALGHALLEYLHSITGRQAVLFAPIDKRNILPQWMRITDNWDGIATGSLVLVDEAALVLNSRNPGAKVNKSFTELNAISRQKGLGLIFVSQSSRSLDINALMAGQVEIIFKNPPTFAGINERKEVRDLAKTAKKLLAGVPATEIKKYSVVFTSGDEVMLMKNGLASYWTEEVSCMYRDVPIGNLNDKKTEVLMLSQQGMTQEQIASKLGISQAYVSMVLAGKK